MFEGIMIKGPLTEEDVKAFADTMRQIERKRPHEAFTLVVIDELATNKEAVGLLNRIFPAVQGVPYDVKSFKRTDVP